jgi:hypothetical protein
MNWNMIMRPMMIGLDVNPKARYRSSLLNSMANSIKHRKVFI